MNISIVHSNSIIGEVGHPKHCIGIGQPVSETRNQEVTDSNL